jgi:MoxR-like ATPase
MSMLTGTPLILDEIDHADVFVQSLMHEALDKRQVFIPELACMIRAEPSCKFIATGNSLTDDSGQYHGEVGTALRTRFAAIHVEYPNQEDERDTVHTASDCPVDVAEKIASTFAALRGACIEQKLTGPISVRESCAVGKLFMQATSDKIKKNTALGMAMKLMVVDKRPRGEQAVASEIIAATSGVSV